MNNKINILIANEENPFKEELIKNIKQQQKYNIISICENGEDTFNNIIKLKPDIILMNLFLNKFDGFNVLEKLKNYHIKIKSKIIIISTVYNENLVCKGFELGCNYFIQIPFEYSLLFSRINEIYNNSNNKVVNQKHFQIERKFIDYKDLDGRELLEGKIVNIIHELCIPSNLKGYQLIIEGIDYCMENKDEIQITKEIYPSISQKHKMSIEKVERNIRNAIEKGWKSVSPIVATEYFGKKSNEKRPTNYEFISTIAEKVKFETKISV